jgi:hypothetical protein
MEVGGQLQTPTILLSGKEPLILIIYFDISEAKQACVINAGT